MYNLYFENSKKEDELVLENIPDSDGIVIKKISEICKRKGIKTPYYRIWKDNNDVKYYDFGSHVEFFKLIKNEVE